MFTNTKVDFFENKPIDILLKIGLYLHPIDLYCFAKTNKRLLYLISQFNLLWEFKLHTYFPNEVFLPSKTKNNYSFFTNTWFSCYQKFTKARQIQFSLVRANDLSSIIERKMTFDIQSLEKYDFKNNSLFSLVRKQNNKELNDYVTKSIYENNPELDETTLIDWEIKLDQN